MFSDIVSNEFKRANRNKKIITISNLFLCHIAFECERSDTVDSK